jgi:hypothetical protein
MSDHLFVDEQGEFATDLNNWEVAFLDQMRKQKDYLK